MKKLILILLLLISSWSVANAQRVGQYDTLLTAGNVQRWVLDSTTVHLGSQICDNGIVFTFSINNKTALKKYCQNGKWVANQLTWKITNVGLNFKLELSDGTAFDLDQLKVNGNDLLRLRGMLLPNKSIPVQDYYFHKDL